LQQPEAAVTDRYSQGAQAREAALCCPVSFNPSYLAVLPEEILERDYGCGDPTPFVREGVAAATWSAIARAICLS
jgi:hypothetical protein